MGLSQAQIRERVFANTYLSAQETERIYQKYFTAPSNTDALLLKRYALHSQRVLEVGCSYGQALIRFGEGSMGLDVRQVFQDFGASIGLDIRLANVEETLPPFEQPFDAIVCENLLEHIVAPHLLLMRFREMLTPEGLVCIKVPVTPPKWVWSLYNRLGKDHGFDNGQHINFFTRKTLSWTVERAGYKTLGLHSPILGRYSALDRLTPVLSPYLPSILIVAQKDPDFRYSVERIAEYNPPYAPDLLPYYLA
jgi:SAM-dependent methyltransferase